MRTLFIFITLVCSLGVSALQAQDNTQDPEYRQHKAQLTRLSLQPTESQSFRTALIRLLYEEKVGYRHWNLRRAGRFADEICIEGKIDNRAASIQVPEWVLILYVNELEDLQARVIYTLDAPPLVADWAMSCNL